MEYNNMYSQPMYEPMPPGAVQVVTTVYPPANGQPMASTRSSVVYPTPTADPRAVYPMHHYPMAYAQPSTSQYANYPHMNTHHHQQQQQQQQQLQAQQQQAQQAHQAHQAQLQRQMQLRHQQQQYEQRVMQERHMMGLASTSGSPPPVLHRQTSTARKQQRHTQPRHALPVMNAVNERGQPYVRALFGPFQLAHELAVSNHEFVVTPAVLERLTHDPQLHLQMKCVHRGDGGQVTHVNNWPSKAMSGDKHTITVTVQVNGVRVPIDSVHREVYIKHMCRPGANTLTITVSECCCSHLFMLQLVERLNEPYVMQLMPRAYMPVPQAKDYLRRLLTAGASGVEVTQSHLPLLCPLTQQRMTTPARAIKCTHMQCFEVGALLRSTAETTRDAPMKCPVCQEVLSVEMLVIDGYVEHILKELQHDTRPITHVVVDKLGGWSIPPTSLTLKAEEDCKPAKRTRTSDSMGSVASPPWAPLLLSPQGYNASPTRGAPHFGPATPHTPLAEHMAYARMDYGSAPYTPASVGSAGSQQQAQLYMLNTATSTGVGSNSSSTGSSGITANELDDLADIYCPSGRRNTSAPHLNDSEWSKLLSDGTTLDTLVATYATQPARKRRSTDMVESDDLRRATEHILSLFD